MPDKSLVLVVEPDGRFADASAGALELFGVDLDTLRTRRVGDFTVHSERGEVRSAFETMVATGDEGLIGEADIIRPDGTTRRVHFTTAPHPDRPGHFLSVIRPLDEPPREARVRTVAQVLADWRLAEREVAEARPGTAEHTRALARTEGFRAEYQEVTGRRRVGP